MTNTEIAAGLQRWSYDPRMSARAREALARAGRRLLFVDGSVEEYAAARTLTDLPRVGPFVARIIHELLDGSRPLSPEVDSWPEAARTAHEKTEASRADFIALHDARLLMQSRAASRPGGDLQMHTTWSDGASTPRGMITGARALGHQFIAITDHSQGLRIAGGMSIERMKRQRSALRRLTDRSGFRVFAGLETNISPTGAIDVEPADLVGTEVVLASPHSGLRRKEDQTVRLVAAVSHAAVHILGHPRGRMFGIPRGVVARWAEVFAAAREHGTAIEVNAYPDRQDIDHSLIREGVDAGCLFSIGSDSHAVHELAYVDIAVAHLITAGAPFERVVNYWPLHRLEAWFRRKGPGT
jgi:putative hydrolase